MMMLDGYDAYESPVFDSGPVYQEPVPQQSYGLPWFPASDPYEPYQSPPYIPPVEAPQQSKYGLPWFPEPQVSRSGPGASVQPRAPINPGVRVGSLFAGPRYSFGGYSQAFQSRGGRGSYQRGFTVEMQERLRRRKKGRRFFE